MRIRLSGLVRVTDCPSFSDFGWAKLYIYRVDIALSTRFPNTLFFTMFDHSFGIMEIRIKCTSLWNTIEHSTSVDL